MENSFDTGGDRDEISARLESASEKNAKMHVTRGERGGDSTRTERAMRGWLTVVRQKERFRKKNNDARRVEDATIRTRGEARGETSAREDRKSAR